MKPLEELYRELIALEEEINVYLDMGEMGFSADESGIYWTADSDRVHKALMKREDVLEAIKRIEEGNNG